jgi:hypothetical protein
VDANTVIAICGVIIAVASLGLSAYVARATRNHNRLSVRPLLGLTATFPERGTAGLRLTNSGLGPARVISSQLTYDGKQFGEFNKANVDEFKGRLAARDRLGVRPHATTLGGHPFLDTDYQQFLLIVDPYDPPEHRAFRQLIETKLRLEIQYESIYGGEGFTIVYPNPQRALVPSLSAEDGYAGGEPI